MYSGRLTTEQRSVHLRRADFLISNYSKKMAIVTSNPLTLISLRHIVTQPRGALGLESQKQSKQHDIRRRPSSLVHALL